MPAVPTLEDLDASGRCVLVRADLNVPLAAGRVTDDLRISASLPTLQRLRAAGACVVVCSHLGRPKGKVVEALRLAPVAERLSQLLGTPVHRADDVVGESARRTVEGLQHGDVALLENLRFDPGEEAGDPDFARRLASLVDAYVNDAFGAAHRAHASIVGVPPLAEQAVAGLLLERELVTLGRLLEDPPRPFVAILGGAKVSDKLGVIANLLERVDTLLIGGAMCFTFLRARGAEVGASKVEEDRLDDCARLLVEAAEHGVEIVLPTDVVAAESFDAHAEHRRVAADAVPEGWMGLDIGADTVERFAEVVARARSVLWNGPMGVFEWEPFAAGTQGVARALARSDAFTVVGGGDSAAALRQMGMDDTVDHVSTGGGASLEFLEGIDLPGVAALRAAARGTAATGEE